jgi:hypothetical protein
MTTATRRRTPQKDRVLDVLRDRGERGTSWLDWAASPPDGRTPIAHLAGVVRQLRDDGHSIETIPARTRNGVIYGVYVLRGDAESVTHRGGR